MKTIAISIDEANLQAIDRLARRSGRGPGRKGRMSRSEIVREAVREYVARQRKQEREEKDRKALAANRDRLDGQLEVLVAEQAEP
jgi:metal-responsive CopG/Arc/MetJ family transcriptional regulator